MTNESTS
jgi:hypothetical protein